MITNSRAEKARYHRVDVQRRRLLRKKYKQNIPRRHWKRRMAPWIRQYMRRNPSSDVERFFIKMMQEYNAKTWDEVENLILEGWVDQYPQSVSDRIFDGPPAPGYTPYNAP